MTAISSFINVWKQLKINEKDELLQLALRECSYFFSRFFFPQDVLEEESRKIWL